MKIIQITYSPQGLLGLTDTGSVYRWSNDGWEFHHPRLVDVPPGCPELSPGHPGDPKEAHRVLCVLLRRAFYVTSDNVVEFNYDDHTPIREIFDKDFEDELKTYMVF